MNSLQQLATAAVQLGDFFAQVAPSPGADIVQSLLTGLGAAGLPTAILWKIHLDAERRFEREMSDMRARHATERNEWRQDAASFDERLFRIADRGMEVGKIATDVARNDSGQDDPRLNEVLDVVKQLLEDRK